MHRKDVIGQCKELCTSYSVLAISGMLSEGSNVEENRYVCAVCVCSVCVCVRACVCVCGVYICAVCACSAYACMCVYIRIYHTALKYEWPGHLFLSSSFSSQSLN